LFDEGKISKPVPIREILWESVIRSGRWRKWLQPDENPEDFYAHSLERQKWFIKTGCRYIWEDPEVVSARAQLYATLSIHGIEAATIVESSIESAMDKYFFRFNLTGLNKFL
jgi:hypothetical protein